jgi:NitT/TauT family transport system substrate-binding protein
MYDNSHTASQMMVAKTSSVTSGRDLTGKVFAINVLHGSAQLFAQSWIDKRGGDSSTVHWIELPFSLMEGALIAGRVDAALIVPPFAQKAQATCRSLGPPGDGIAPRFLNGAYVVTETWLAAHRGAAARFNAVISKDARYYNANPSASVQAVADLTKQDAAVITSSVRAIFGDSLDPALLQPVIDVGARYGLLKRPFPATEIIAQV